MKAIPIESIKNIKGNDRLRNEILRAIEKEIIETVDLQEKRKIKTKHSFLGADDVNTKSTNS